MKKKVLFLCTGNSCRSQMAEGFLRSLAGDRFEVFSAGVNPTQVNLLSVKVMNEVGIDISMQKSKSAMDLIGKEFDYVVTVCDNAKQTCPVFPGKYEKIHWNLEDPADAKGVEEEKLAEFRKSRDLIKKKAQKWLQEVSQVTDLKTTIKCPECDFEKEETMPTNSCQFFYKCTKCGVTLKPKDGDCCVFCSYADKKCPPKQCKR